eukprot:m.35081 g.35081  ORF g.35081 m.35081 type:complete len:591 (-) comp9846_c0_seq1:177-1949(-)
MVCYLTVDRPLLITKHALTHSRTPVLFLLVWQCKIKGTMSTVNVTPFEGQKPGTSGLRKKAKVFEQQHYREAFIQSTFNALTDQFGSLEGKVLVAGGDGRYLVKDTLQILIKMAHASKIGKLIVGQAGLFSTPAVSAIIRRHQCDGGFIFTASHNPGGPDEDFGIKYNIANGGPAPSSVTNAIFEHTKTIAQYSISTDVPDVDLDTVGSTTLGSLTVEVVDPVEEYVTLMKELFDFEMLKKVFATGSFKILVDCLNGAAGPYATRIFEQELGAPAQSVVNNIPLEDFGGLHPDPNLVYGKSLVDAMKTGDYDMGFAYDGDADRFMLIGKKGFFVSPSDSVAVIAANYKCIPYLAKSGLAGVSRSMPTGGALDRVAQKLGLDLYEVPTGWKFFGNLMDAGKLTICGEESFGTGSSHIREKDGVWASLCWLSIVASRGESVQDILYSHWEEYGRNYFTRYDYETVASEAANEVMALMETYADTGSNPLKGQTVDGMQIATCDNFEYTDVTNGEVTSKQGLRMVFADGSRIVMRLSGTGSSGATIRLYIDSYINEPTKLRMDAQEALKPLVALALKLSNLQELTGRDAPSVIT